MKKLLIILILIVMSYLLIGTLTSSSLRDINSCYDQADKYADEILQRYEVRNYDAREKCTFTTKGIRSLQQCMSGITERNGKFRTALTRKILGLLSFGKMDPLTSMIANHNTSCSIFPELLINSDF